jgi:hypothetical protein
MIQHNPATVRRAPRYLVDADNLKKSADIGHLLPYHTLWGKFGY